MIKFKFRGYEFSVPYDTNLEDFMYGFECGCNLFNELVEHNQIFFDDFIVQIQKEILKRKDINSEV